jgi:predicted alpha/beta-fold hydrolase
MRRGRVRRTIGIGLVLGCLWAQAAAAQEELEKQDKTMAACVQALPESTSEDSGPTNFIEMGTTSIDPSALPAGFREVPAQSSTRPGAGERLKLDAAVSLAAGRRPMVVFLPGAFGSHRAKYLCEAGQLMAQGGKFHAMLLATRMTRAVSQKQKVAGSGGILEGHDLLEVVQWLKTESEWASRISAVGVCGTSMSANYVLHAMALDTRKDIAAALCLSPAFNIQEQCTLFDTQATDSSLGFTNAVALSFQKDMAQYVEGLQTTGLVGKNGTGYTGKLGSYLSGVSYSINQSELASVTGGQLTADEYIEQTNTNSASLIAKVRSPLMILHSERDTVVGRERVDEFVKLAAANPLIASKFVKNGDHNLFAFRDPAWFQQFLGQYFTYWMGAGEAGQAINGR